ncbi:transporter [Thauera humireducens]|uniref:Phenol degradation protein meta n=1 Tax=Thauera humireducens TaxID=1134435 RepID=A0A127K5F6_9RHOO|nr:transporter [Thauera humireducens]AMO37189.1 hypothetical protein AC731_009610 [Thauera humireducens]
MNPSKRLRTALARSALAGYALAASGAASALDVDAGDYTALPEGTQLALVYYQHAEIDHLYADGRKGPGKLSTDAALFRYVYFTRIGDYIIDPQIIVPYVGIDAKGALADAGVNSPSGFGDTLLGATLWLHNDPKAGDYFGLTYFLSVPTGDYDRHDALNIGADRYSHILQAGYIKRLSPKWTMDLVLDATIHGDNKKANAAGDTLEQDTTWQAQAWLRYHVSDTLDLRASVSRYWGGETKLGGVSQDDETNRSKFTIGTAWFVEPSLQLIANVGRDISVDNGAKEDSRLNLRLLKVF